MDNGFFAFVKAYWTEIYEFLQAFVDFVKALFNKSADAEEE